MAMTLAYYRKAIVAVLSAAVAVLTPFVPGIETIVTPEYIQNAAMVLGPILVYAIPNAVPKV